MVAQVADSGASYVPGEAWRRANPSAVGFDAPRLRQAMADASNGRYGTIHGVVVVRYGWQVTEQFRDWSPSQPHTLQSVTKSITSLLYGIATNGGTSPNGELDRRVTDVFARYAPFANDDPHKRALTMRDLLTMRTSMDSWEQPYAGSPLECSIALQGTGPDTCSTGR
jgi:CubicO group peptidase (beta-lactamase class C family)